MKSNYIYKGRVLNLKIDDIKLPNKKIVKHEIVEHQGSVAILAIDNDEVLLVKQYRSPFKSEVLEIPAGIIEFGEKSYEAGLRELQEETGAYTNKLVYLGEVYPSPGYTDEIVHLYFTDQVEIKKPNPDEDEFIKVERVKFSKVLQMIEEGKIVDAKTIIAILKYKLIKGGLR